MASSAVANSSNEDGARIIGLKTSEPSQISRWIRISPSEPILIGRASKATDSHAKPNETTAYFECPVISRHHAELALKLSAERCARVTITDLGSMHGTFVNGKGLMKHDPFYLMSGDVIRLGSSVSRGPEYYRGITLTFCDGPSSPVLGASSRTFSVPAMTDEEDSLYGSDSDSVFDSVINTSSPTTSPTAEEPVGSQDKPIDLDGDNNTTLRNVIDLVGPSEFTSKNVLDDQQPIEIDATEVPLPIIEEPKLAGYSHIINDSYEDEGPEIMSSRQDGAQHSHVLNLLDTYKRAGMSTCTEQPAPVSISLPDVQVKEHQQPAAIEPKQKLESRPWVQTLLSPSKMAIPNMLSPSPPEPSTADLNPTTVVEPTAQRPHETVLSLSEVASSKTLCTRGTLGKRKLDDDFSTSWAGLGSELVDGPPWMDQCGILKRDLLEGRYSDLFDPRPIKRARKTLKSKKKATSMVREASKYTLGAAVGAVSTFAFLASPIGGRFAEWLSTL